MTLKTLLHNRIKQDYPQMVKAGDLKYLVENVWVKDEIDSFKTYYTWRTAIRVLNKSTSGQEVETVYNNGAIVGYRWIGATEVKPLNYYTPKQPAMFKLYSL